MSFDTLTKNQSEEDDKKVAEYEYNAVSNYKVKIVKDQESPNGNVVEESSNVFTDENKSKNSVIFQVF